MNCSLLVPRSIGFSRQEYWSELSFLSPGNLPNLGIKPRSTILQAGALPSEPPGKDWSQEEKGRTEDEAVGWHHRLNGHESEHTPRDCEGQESLACCNPWGCRVVHDWAELLHERNNNVAFYSLLKQNFCIYRVLKCDIQKMNICISNFCLIC